MFKIRHITQTSYGCPSQWEGVTTQGERVYIRYRYGHLSVDLDGEQVYSRIVGTSQDGVISLGRVRDLVGFSDRDWETPSH